MKYCIKCKKNKLEDNFYIDKNGKLSFYCKECSRKRTKKWYWEQGGKEKTLKNQKIEFIKNPELKKQKYRDWAWKRKIEAINHYGGKCACCGESEPKFLAIDHKNNNGNKHRKEIGNVKIYTWLKKNNWPKEFQVLCHNCNMAKAFWKVCPHKEITGIDITVCDVLKKGEIIEICRNGKTFKAQIV
jgi:hypothetical protein